jgi:hypothetical protein
MLAMVCSIFFARVAEGTKKAAPWKEAAFKPIEQKRITDVCAVYRWILLISYVLFYDVQIPPCVRLQLTYAHEIRACFFSCVAMVGKSVSLYFILKLFVFKMECKYKEFLLYGKVKEIN